MGKQNVVRLFVVGLAGLALAGCARTEVQGASNEASVSARRTIEITAGDRGFAPSRVEVKPGEAVTLRFTRTTSNRCLNAVVLPDLDIRKEMPLDKPVEVPVTAPSAGSITYRCGMGIYQGNVVVSESP